jgi:putative hemolysin
MPVRNASIEKPEGALFRSDSFKFLSVLDLLVPQRFRELYRNAAQAEDQPILEALLSEMQVSLNVEPADLARIPAFGASIVVANHPFGMLDGIALGALALRVRSDVKLLVNQILASIPELAPHCIFVDPFQGKNSKQANVAGLRQAVAHLRGGGMLIVFPGGEVSHWQFRHGEICDPEWSDSAARLACATEASVLPVLFLGTNSLPFHLMGLIHPMLRTVRLPHELVNKFGKQVDVCIGNPIPAEKISSIADMREATEYMRWRTYLLRNRQPARVSMPVNWEAPASEPPPQQIASPVASNALLDELRSLGPGGCVVENREFAVYSARGDQIPNLLSEIGRQREITFREVGEGSGKAADLDEYDPYYTHLILWGKSKQELVGGYRLVNTEEVLESRGVAGLYTSSLFKFRRGWFEQIGPALELGRSFVRLEYQKQYASLLMLWKGIASYVARHPETPVLFGAVSVSNRYTQASRELIVEFFKSQADPLAKLVRPKCAFPQNRLRQWELSSITTLLDLEELSESIAEVEQDGKGLPVLFKQYLKVGGRILAFNLDKNFSNVLDGLVLVDLRRTERSRLETYMSKEGMEAFLRYHSRALLSEPAQAAPAIQ